MTQQPGRATGTTHGRSLTRKQLTRRQQEERNRRILYAVVGGALLISLLLILIPFLKQNVWDPRQTLAQVGEDRITRGDWDRYQLISAIGLAERELLSNVYGQWQISSDTVRSQLDTAAEEARPNFDSIPASTVDPMINDRILVRSADELGVDVSDEAADRELLSWLGPSTAPNAQPTPGAASSPAITGTPGVAAEQPPGGTPTPGSEPPTEDSADEFFGVIDDTLGVSREEYTELVVKPKMVEEAVKADRTSGKREQVHVRHILVSTEEEAREILDELKSGTKFEQLARERSLDTGNKDLGGDLGWAPRGLFDPAFEQAAFALKKPGDLSGPAKSQFGYHIIQVLEPIEQREMTEAQKSGLGEKFLDDFVKEKRAELEAQDEIKVNLPATPTPAPTSQPVASPAAEQTVSPVSTPLR